jgi:hypothetical protein
MLKPFTLRHVVALFLATASAAGGAALAPAAPAGAVRYRISPAVRAVVRKLAFVDLPAAERRRNWIGDRGQGSCVHAALVHLFHWQGRHELARWWGAQYGNGETADGLAAKLDAAGISFAETRSGDEAFLDWAIRTRRGAAVVVQNGAHMVTLVGLDRDWAQILDSNSPERIQTWPRERLVRDWQAGGGWAVTPLGTPPAPSPWVVQAVAPPEIRGAATDMEWQIRKSKFKCLRPCPIQMGRNSKPETCQRLLSSGF